MLQRPFTTTGRACAPAPLLLTLPGIDNSGPDHWQSLWERDQADFRRVDLGDWALPQRAQWVARLEAAIASASRPVILVAHSLGCHAAAWWSAQGSARTTCVAGALLVAPPDVEDAPIDARLCGFGPVARQRLAFPSLLVASRNDPYTRFGQARRMARIWGSQLIDAGPMGHINAASGLKDWPYGLFLLRRLIASITPAPTPLLADGAAAYFAQRQTPSGAPR
ncbi:alpha/beta fold hydrolase [Novosphingobium sp. 1949]|uniref:Alpha/beta fold hydrolase n=1 Tax=Novosphingobium organovorum TaxID=2930092 RepID=A0ABT0BF67_9SPHN|nr:alpha/beta hydrolase [Novosphingobium organovorum]MCJ2183555.1 alpha/beta fold hydrolase [Novosphingobium organovorum]